ncbi:MAG: ubiquinone oxidoreductase 20 kDa subunit [candidate division NC10 bacterium]|nr:ubiquinone oxidoreductase 20 kDa subunit [candidate division NC10 bacterium]
MSAKPKVAFYWCASCGGCEESVVDLAETILDVVAKVDIVMWPVAMDFKRHDVEAMPDGSILASLINGAIRSSEQEEMARLLRRKSRIVVAYGACAHQGGIPGLGNQFPRSAMMKYVYEDSPSTQNPERVYPTPAFQDQGRLATLPNLWHVVRTLDQVIDVDYYLPGCPPTPKLLGEALGALLSGQTPPKGTVLAPDIALCDQCPRKETKPTDLAIREFKRPHLALVDPEKCLLAQGFLCMGPATRGGCEASCIGGNMPCSGCFGPTSRVRDQGAKMLSSVCSAISATDDKEIQDIVNTIPDPVGTLYRYGLAASLLRRRADLQA